MKKEFYFSMDIVKSSNSKDSDFIVEGYASTPDMDRQGDIIALSALVEAAPEMLENGQTVFFNHDYARCIGRLDNVEVDEKGLKVKLYVSEWEQELRKKISERIINKFSIGGRFIKWQKLTPSEAMNKIPELKERPLGPVTLIEKLELFEVSIVGLPANAKAEFNQKSLYQALKDASQEQIDDLGQIPDNTSTHVLPKPVTKNEGDVVMEKVETTEVQKSTIEAAIESTEVRPEETIVEGTKATEELTQDVVKAQEKVTTVSQVLEEKTTTTEDEGKYEVKTETQEKVTVATECPAGVCAENAVKVTEVVETNQVRTFTIEEVQEMQKEFQRQLEEKESTIQSLIAEVEATKAQVEPVTKTVPETAAPEVIEEVKGKSTPLAPIGIEQKREEVQLSPDAQFLGILKGFKI